MVFNNDVTVNLTICYSDLNKRLGFSHNQAKTKSLRRSSTLKQQRNMDELYFPFFFNVFYQSRLLVKSTVFFFFFYFFLIFFFKSWLFLISTFFFFFFFFFEILLLSNLTWSLSSLLSMTLPCLIVERLDVNEGGL